jgi:hypothetical protein
MVVGVSLSTALVQESLRRTLRAKLPADNGTDIAEVCFLSFWLDPLSLLKQLVRRIRESLDYVDQLDPATQIIVRASYEKSLLMAFIFTAIFSFLTVACSVFLKEKPIDRK